MPDIGTAATDIISNEPVELSIVLPCLNEAETIEQCVGVAVKCLRDNKISGEVLVGDNGSTDGSQDMARRAGARVVDIPQRGYGAALMGAVEASHGRFIVMADADMSYDFAASVEFLEKLREGNDLVMGNRFKGGIMPGAMPFKNRWLGNPVLTSIGRIIYSSPIADFHSGMRGFTRAAYDAMNLRTTGMEFASEMVVKATVMKMKLAEVPIVLHPDGRSRPPHLKPWSDGWRHLRFLLLLSPRWTLVYPGVILTLVGLAIGLPLLMGFSQLGRIRLGPHTLAASGFMIMVGYTAITVGIAARIYTMQEELGPPSSATLNRWFQLITLERGLIAGALMLVAGFLVAGWVVVRWWQTGFGPLPLESTIRPMLVGGFLVAIGFQTVLMSFFYSMLGLSVRDRG
ncbi:MAG: glycosyltransferase family 2 protein [Gemmatimonadaceae bacterium]